MHIFGELAHIFRELAHIFGKLVHIFARKLVSRTSKQVSKNLGPLWQPGVYNDTNVCWVQRSIVKCGQGWLNGCHLDHILFFTCKILVLPNT